MRTLASWLSGFAALCMAVASPSAQAQPRELVLAAGTSIPPYLIKDDKSGIQVDIMKAALSKKGYTIKELRYVSNKRLIQQLREREVDGALFAPYAMPGLHYTDTLHNFENYAITLESKGLVITSIADLADKRVVAFQDAGGYLGPKFGEMKESNPRYKEVVDQVGQVGMLYMDRADVVVADKHIFLYYASRAKNIPQHGRLVYHDIFAATPAIAAFVDVKIRDDFNAGLREIRKSGEYDAIFSKYIPGYKSAK